ncbi:VWA domain-containing protein, partial [Campylobacter canadensis]
AWASYGGFFEADSYGRVYTTGKQRYHVNQKFEKVLEYDSSSGCQAKIFKDRNTGEYILAIRGTEIYFNYELPETIKDFAADVNLFVNSIPGAQYRSLIELINNIKNNNVIEDLKLDKGDKMIVVGHSLGGALAQLVCKSFPNEFKECYTFNAPSVKNLFSKPVFQEEVDMVNKYFYYKEDVNNETYSKIYLDDILGSALYNYQSKSMTPDVTNVRAKYGFSPVANLWGKDTFGKLIEVAADTHSIIDLTKVLYFYDEMIKHGVSESQVNEYIDKFHTTKYPTMSDSSIIKIVENTMKGINEITNNSSNKNSVMDIFLANDESRMDYKINLLNSNSSISKIFGGSNLTIPALYSLVKLKPFIVSNISSPAYDEIMQYKDEYTDEYIKDKISMFETAFGKLKYQGIHYSDYETGISIYDTQYFNGVYDECIFGTNSDDVIKDLNTNSEINKIYTLAGNDTIYGSKGKDIIYGGNGFDTYYVGDKDEIIDSDDNGKIFFNNTLLGESKQSSENPNVYISKADENIQYELKGSDLIITNIKTKESFTITNYSKDKQSLGLSLGDKSKVEMAFLSDTTGSMSGAINSVKSQIQELVNLAFNKDVNTRIGVFGYNDPYTETFTNLTNDKASIINAINSLYASGGGDYPELTYSGIIRAATSNWSEGADKRLFLFGDAIAKDSYLKDKALGLLKSNQQRERAIDVLKKEGIKVYAIYTGNDEEAFSEFKELALSTGGESFKLDDDSLVADKIFDAINYGTSSND